MPKLSITIPQLYPFAFISDEQKGIFLLKLEAEMVPNCDKISAIMVTQQTGLSNLQQELLKLYGNNVSDETLLEIKSILARYFADRASNAMDNVWNKQGLTPKDMASWANEHNRVEDCP